jgi:hypothetical protein
MREIEDAVQPYMKPMIRGQLTTLDATAQSTVAAWGALKAIVATYLPETNPVDDNWIEWMYVNHQSPPEWHVWIAHYSGLHTIFHESANIVSPVLLTGSKSLVPQGVLADFLLGSLLMKVLGVYRNDLNFSTDAALRISPDQLPSVQWPPRTAFSDAELPTFFEFHTERRSGVRVAFDL